MEKFSAITETKNVISPRVEIDTSAPFESVKEAVDMFSSRGQWMPQHLSSDNVNAEVIIAEKLEEHACQLERDLIIKEEQTLKILKELEAAKTFVEDLKFQVTVENDRNSSNPIVSKSLEFMDLNHAKSSLSKTTSDLDRILASVESLNEKMSNKDDALLGNRTIAYDQIHNNLTREVNFEADQFKKMTEASRYEVMKAMSEIERTKNSIRMAEMRLNAAKKIEEAAKAVKAIAIAESEAPSRDDGITLSLDEYRVLTQRAKQCELELCKNKLADDDRRIEVPVMEKFEETSVKEKEGLSKFRFRNSYRSPNERSVRALRTMNDSADCSINTKMIVRDDVVVERHVENNDNNCSETPQHVSLSQMLKKQSRLILHHPAKPTVDGNVNVKKQYFVQRKKFGFIQVPIPTVQSKKKM